MDHKPWCAKIVMQQREFPIDINCDCGFESENTNKEIK